MIGSLRPRMIVLAATSMALLGACSEKRSAVEFCLDGEFDLGARYQGLRPEAGERYPTRFCYTTEDGVDHVMFSSSGHSNPDMQDNWTVSFLPPDKVRIVNRQSPPDVEFSGKNIVDEALRYRRTDPRRLLAEIEAHGEWLKRQSAGGWRTVQFPGSEAATHLLIVDGKLQEVHTMTDFPLRGRVPVVWRWRWYDEASPQRDVLIEDDIVFTAIATWRTLSAAESRELWRVSGNQEPVDLPGDRWPALINPEIQQVAPGVHLVSGVRTGFSHIVIETVKGLVVGDAPAGWVELQQLPPADLVPGYSISGLSENFIDYLGEQFPDAPIRAVAITHVHDDHAAGARAFAAAGADVYVPTRIATFLTRSLNRSSMPDDRLSQKDGRVDVLPVLERLTLSDESNEVELLVLPGGPHVDTALGIWAKDAGVFFQSDLHVPRSDADAPRVERAVTECWFAEWAVANLPADTIVLNSHTPPSTPVSRLAKYLASDICDQT